MPRVVRVTRNKPHKKLRAFNVGTGLPSPEAITLELGDMRDVLMGREDPPVGGTLALMEVADAYFARACELEQIILAGQREGFIAKTSPYNQIRTQEIRSFKELAKSAAELGSRRVTAEKMRFDNEMSGRES